MQQWGPEEWGIVGVINPANNNNNTFLSNAIDMSKWSELYVILQLGAIDITIDMKLRDSATSGGTYADISGKAITQLTGGTQDNNQYIIGLKAEELNAGTQFVKVSVTVANGTSSLICLCVLGKAVYKPATDNDLTTVAQVVY